MEEDEFLKEHPSLKGKVTDFSKEPLLFSDRNGYTKYASIGQVHETQLDKQKVKEAIDKTIKFLGDECYQNATVKHDSKLFDIYMNLDCKLKELKKEFGLE